MTAVEILILFLPLLVSLAGQGGMAKMLCLVTSILAMLLSVREYGAVLPWLIGMTVAVVAVREKIRLPRTA